MISLHYMECETLVPETIGHQKCDLQLFAQSTYFVLIKTLKTPCFKIYMIDFFQLPFLVNVLPSSPSYLQFNFFYK